MQMAARGWRDASSLAQSPAVSPNLWINSAAQATKEAEHRDRLAELRARGDAARERSAAEQELIVTSRLRREQADKCAACPDEAA